MKENRGVTWHRANEKKKKKGEEEKWKKNEEKKKEGRRWVAIRKETGRRDGGRERRIANWWFLQRLIIIVNFAWKIESRLDSKVEQFFRFCFGHLPPSSFSSLRVNMKKKVVCSLERRAFKRLKDIWQTGRMFLLCVSFETCFHHFAFFLNPPPLFLHRLSFSSRDNEL